MYLFYFINMLFIYLKSKYLVLFLSWKSLRKQTQRHFLLLSSILKHFQDFSASPTFGYISLCYLYIFLYSHRDTSVLLLIVFIKKNLKVFNCLCINSDLKKCHLSSNNNTENMNTTTAASYLWISNPNIQMKPSYKSLQLHYTSENPG